MLARVSIALLGLSALACASIQPVSQPREFIAKYHPSVMYVVYNDNSTVAVARPHLRGDTLRGTEVGMNEQVSVPLNQVQVLKAVQKDKKQTTFLIVGMTVVATLGTYAFLQTTSGQGGMCTFVERGVDVTRPCSDPRP